MSSNPKEAGDGERGVEGQRPGCLMCDSLYLKANGELPCWDDAGEERILARLDLARLAEGELVAPFAAPPLIAIRADFLEGRFPHPGLCERCAVRGHGRVRSTHPTVLRVLHVEPSYLCHLACPHCIPPRQRRRLKEPPYDLPPAAYEGLLRSLQEGGVERILFVHFEGRGEPLMNPRLGEMIAATKHLFPDAFTKVTTHGNFPFRPWMLESGLDLLRISVDGARQESYARYRVGGSLERALSLMRDIRDRRQAIPSPLQVEWKYILFEWNDRDEEIREAHRLARDLDVRLRFCLTHAAGRSRRFPDPEALHAVLSEIAPSAAHDLTFQLKLGGGEADVEEVVGEHVAAKLASALRHGELGEEETASRLVREALGHDPGMDLSGMPGPPAALIERAVATVVEGARHPSTLTGLAALAQAAGAIAPALALLRRYLELAPGARDGAEVRRVVGELEGRLAEGHLRRAIELERAGDGAGAEEAVREALRLDPGFREEDFEAAGAALVRAGAESEAGASVDAARALAPAILTRCRRAGTLAALGNLALGRGDPGTARSFLARYLELEPGAADGADVCRVVGELEGRLAEGHLRRAIELERAGDGAGAEEAVRKALRLDPGFREEDFEAAGAEAGVDPARALAPAILTRCHRAGTLAALGNLALGRGDTGTARSFLARYLELAPDAPDRTGVRRTLNHLRLILVLRRIRRALA